MVRIAMRSLLVAVVCLLAASNATASILMTFEGLQNNEQVANYYNGGSGSLGSGPGPSYGVTFSSNALALIKSPPFPNDPSPPTVLLLADLANSFGAGYPLTMTMDVSGGLAHSLNFYYIAIDRVSTVKVWSGLDGTGTLLASENLTLLNAGKEVFLGPVTMPFDGVAHSVVFAGGNLQLAFDDISFSAPLPIPEPASCALLGLGLLSVGTLARVCRRIAP